MYLSTMVYSSGSILALYLRNMLNIDKRINSFRKTIGGDHTTYFLISRKKFSGKLVILYFANQSKVCAKVCNPNTLHKKKSIILKLRIVPFCLIATMLWFHEYLINCLLWVRLFFSVFNVLILCKRQKNLCPDIF